MVNRPGFKHNNDNCFNADIAVITTFAYKFAYKYSLSKHDVSDIKDGVANGIQQKVFKIGFTDDIADSCQCSRKCVYCDYRSERKGATHGRHRSGSDFGIPASTGAYSSHHRRNMSVREAHYMIGNTLY